MSDLGELVESIQHKANRSGAQTHDDVWFRQVFLPTVGKFVSAQVRPLKDEITALKSQVAEIQDHGFKYAGVWQRAGSYAKGTVVTFDGSMFVAVKETQPAQAPLASEVWQLAVKAGRDARQPTTGHRNAG